MILVDSSVWTDHFRSTDAVLVAFLQQEQVICHPAVTGELALGQQRREALVIEEMSKLPQAEVATHEEVLHFIDRHGLGGSGIGYADSHLLASATLTPDATFWTRDRRLLMAARRLGLDAGVEPYLGLQEEEANWDENGQDD